MKGLIKSLLARLIFESHLSRILLRNSAVIVAFHRVQDRVRSDGLTIDVGMFERYCRFFARHFRVLTFDPRGNGRSDRPAGGDAYAEREFMLDTLAVVLVQPIKCLL